MGCNQSVGVPASDVPLVGPHAEYQKASFSYTGRPFVVFVLGGPGSGKGTQCSMIARDYGFVHLSTGDLLRKEENNPESPNAEFIKNRLKEGKMVPVEISVNLLLREMQQNVREGRSLFLIDGFPRNQDNVDGWNRVVGDYAEVAFALFFDCAEQVMLERLKKRGETSGRSDDGLDVIMKRFRTFQQDSMPIVEQFDGQGKLRKVSAMDTKENVYEVVRKVFDTEIDLWRSKLEADEAKRKTEKLTIAVVTGNSNTGFATVRSLSAISAAVKDKDSQFTVRAVVRSEDKAARLRGLPNVDVVVDPLDITKPHDLKRVFTGAHKALIAPPSAAENRVEIAKAFIDAARRGGVSHSVLISVLGAANQSILFQKQFRAMELHLCASGMKWTYLRCSAFTDLFLSTRDSILKRGEFYGCSGGGKFAAIPTEEVGRCAAVVLSNQTGSHDNKIYDLTGPAPYSQSEYAELMTKVMGYPIKYVDLPNETVQGSLMNGAGWPEWRAKGLVELLETIKLGNAALVTNDVRKLLGKQMSFEQWVSSNAIQWDRRDVAAVLTGNSNTGFATVRALLSPPYSEKLRVRAAVRHESKAKVLRDLRQAMEVVTGIDASQPSTLQPVFEGAKVAFISVPNYDANRVQLAKNMIDAAVQHGVQHVTIVSLIGGTEETLLGKQFREIEQHLANAGVSYAVLRLAPFAENFIGSKDTIVKDGYFFGATGEGKYAAVSLDDVGRCAAVTLTDPEKLTKKVFELTGPKALSGAEYAQLFSNVLGYNVMYRDEPRDVIVKFMVESGWPKWQAEGMGELMGHMAEQKHGWVSNDVQLLTNSHTEFETFLGSVSAIFSRKGVAITKPTVAVVTGNSNTGFATLRALVSEYSQRVKIRAVVRTADKAARIKALGVEVASGVDANQINSFKQAFDGVSAVFIVTPNFVENRADLSKTMIDAAKKFGVRHVVIMSVSESNLQRSVFERQFYAVEQHAIASGLTYSCLRCAYFMDNWLGSRDAIVQHKAIYGCHGDGKFAAVAVDDIGRAAAACLAFPDRHRNKVYSITGPRTLNGAEYASVFSKLLGHSVQYIDQPGEQFQAALVSFGFPEWQSAALVQMFDQIRSGQMQYSVSDDVKRVTGRQTSFEDWVEANAAFFGKPSPATPAPAPAETSDEPPQKEKGKGIIATIVAAVTEAKEGADSDADKPVETTYAMIKPDVVNANRDEDLVAKIKELGFDIVAKKNLYMDQELAEEFYAEHKGRSFFPDLVTFMTSGPSVAMALRKRNAIKAWREALGPTNTAKAKESAPNSIRALFGTDQQANAAHGSDSAASAKRELKLIFPDLLV